jgi:hypothetical protein
VVFSNAREEMKHAHEDLIQRNVDGCLTDSEREKLRGVLEHDPGAWQAQTELEELVGVLQRLEEIEPPTGLREEILAALPQQSAPLGQRLLATLGGGGRAWFPRSALLAAAGVVAVLLIFNFVPLDFNLSSVNELTGALVPSTASQPPGNEVSLEEPWLTGSVRVESTENGIAVSLEMTTDERVRMVLRYDAAYVTFVGLERQDEKIEELQRGDDRVVLTVEGPTRSELLLKRTAPGKTGLTFDFFGSGGRIHQVILPLPEL